jgi:hypothetical protein
LGADSVVNEFLKYGSYKVIDKLLTKAKSENKSQDEGNKRDFGQ